MKVQLIVGVLLLFLAALAFGVGVSAFVGWIFMMIWNAAVVPTFDAPELSFWVAWGIWFLIGLVDSAFRSTMTVTTKRRRRRSRNW